MNAKQSITAQDVLVAQNGLQKMLEAPQLLPSAAKGPAKQALSKQYFDKPSKQAAMMYWYYMVAIACRPAGIPYVQGMDKGKKIKIVRSSTGGVLSVGSLLWMAHPPEQKSSAAVKQLYCNRWIYKRQCSGFHKAAFRNSHLLGQSCVEISRK